MAGTIRKLLAEKCPTCDGHGYIVNGQWLRRRREAAGVSQKEMAARAHRAASFLCDVEKNRRRASAELVELYENLKG